MTGPLFDANGRIARITRGYDHLIPIGDAPPGASDETCRP